MSAPTILCPIANGTEEMEAVTIIDMLRRAGLEVVVAGDGDMVTCSRGVRIIPDISIDDIGDEDEYDGIVVAGGGQGVENLSNNTTLSAVMVRHRKNKVPIGAICAAPVLLHDFGLIQPGDTITSHPSVADDLRPYAYSLDRVVHHDGIITSRGAGTAIEFALTIIQMFTDEATAMKVATDIVLYE